jgi:energy-converting hydrogenase Eha subunit A
MNILLFFVLWTVFALGVPIILHTLFGTSEYPLVSLGVVVGFVGGALLSALIAGLFKAQQPTQSK